MRVFKNSVLIVLIIYLFAIIIEQINNKIEAGTKFSILEQSNLKNKNNPRLILYGSSHCDFGLSAKKITKITKIKTINLCNYGIERKIYIKGFRNKLLSLLNENDIIIYSFRINTEKIPLEESGILGFLLPQFRTTINYFIKSKIKKESSFDKYGDRIFYPKFNKTFNYPSYSIDYNEINSHIDRKINSILSDKNFKSKVVVIITPLLIKNKSKINLQKIKFKCTNNCKNFLGLQKPLLIEDKKFFLLAEHLNPEMGRDFWTNSVINFLKKNVNFNNN